jgi:hypothetical protein
MLTQDAEQAGPQPGDRYGTESWRGPNLRVGAVKTKSFRPPSLEQMAVTLT